jgi:hypothetical protein
MSFDDRRSGAMKRLSGRIAARRLIAVAGAGALLSAGLGVAAASAASGAVGPAAGPPATKVPMVPCAIKYVAGNLYVGSGSAVYKVSQRTGAVTGIAPTFAFAQACGAAVDAAGNVLVADGAMVVAVAAKTGTFYGEKMIKGNVYPIAGGFQGTTGAVDVQLDPSGNVVIAVGGEPASHTDNEQDSQIFVLAERAGTFYGKRMTKGKLAVIAGVLNGGSSPSPCDGPDARAAAAAAPAATKAAQANLGYDIGTLRFDAAGNIILADSGGDSGSPCGALFYDVHQRVAVIPARTGTYYGRKMTVGDIYSIAGLGTKTGNGVPAADSGLPAVSAVAIDHDGNVLVAVGDTEYTHAVRVIAANAGTFYGQKMIKGDIYSLPGLDGASAVAVDSAGNVLAGNRNDDLVRMLAVTTGDFYGMKVRAGRVYTIAGDGKPPAP